MKVFFDELHDNYDILNLSYNDLVELNKALNSCQLPQKRIFYKIKKDIDNFISNRKLPKKKIIKYGKYYN